MKKYFILAYFFFLFFSLSAVPPCPEKNSNILNIKEYPSEKFSKYHNKKNSNVPDSILVLLVDFPDVKFRTDSTSFDGFNHNIKFFKKYMEHLSEYYTDASHGKYNLVPENYYFFNHTITLSKPMSYYGDDENWTERIAIFLKEIVETIDDTINFKNYDSIIIFHAGAGQETDISGNNSDDLWTTFLTRKSLQQGLDPDNDNFEGIETNDGIYIKEAIVMPESEIQPDYSEGDIKYGMLGVLAHEFGHLLGLPTLFDNYSSNGRSAGIGNFGVMGTGVWNANGYVPPLPCAWSRYYLGWEDNNVINITTDEENCKIAYPMMNTLTPKLYKINISPKEYFLIENRQQNPDNSTIHGFPNFTFTLLPDSLQDYYPPPNQDVPRFNFMTNSYAGCEWDFFLPGPGYGSPPDSSNTVINGSGLFIWHIDEYMINELFDPNFEMNYVNYDASHKGVDLEEACGYQYLDNIQTMDSFGTPYDSYRLGNNDYFGYDINPFTNLMSFPTSESYYGGTNIEIYNISSSSNIMMFSVKFAWNLNPDYSGNAKYPPLITTLKNSNKTKIVNIMPDGHIFLWNENEELDNSLPTLLNPIVELYAFDNISKKLILPSYDNNTPFIYTYSDDISDFNTIYFDSGYKWATHPIINNLPTSLYKAFIPLNKENQFESKIIFLDEFFQKTAEKKLENYKIISNMMLANDTLYIMISDSTSIKLATLNINNENAEINYIELDFLKNKQIFSNVLADMDNNGAMDIILQDTDSLLYVFDNNGNLFENFPLKMKLNAYSLPSISDITGNGEPDILIGGENSFLIVDKTGKTSQPCFETPFPDSLCKASGVLGYDINGDDKFEVVGNFSKNRLVIWENKNNNDFIFKENPISYREFSPFAPVIANYQTNKTDSGLFIFVATNNGLIFRKKISGLYNENFWYTDYANYQRTASYTAKTENIFKTDNIFVDDQTYIYPNPLSKIYNSSIFNGNENINKIAVRYMVTVNKKITMKYFNSAGNLLGKQSKIAKSNIADVFYIDANKLSSGIYFCVIKCDGKIKKFKFAIEK